MIQLHADALDHYRRAPDAASALADAAPADASAGLDATQLAAWTAVASVLLNMDEVLTKP